MKVTQLCPALCDPLDYTVHGISQTAIVEWAAVSYSSPFLLVKESEVSQSCPTLCDPMDCSLPGFSVRGILQARILEWVTISFSRGSSQPRDQTRVSCTAGRFFTDWATRVVRSCLKSCMLGFSIMWTKNFQMFKLGLEKELDIKMPTFIGL